MTPGSELRLGRSSRSEKGGDIIRNEVEKKEAKYNKIKQINQLKRATPKLKPNAAAQRQKKKTHRKTQKRAERIPAGGGEVLRGGHPHRGRALRGGTDTAEAAEVKSITEHRIPDAEYHTSTAGLCGGGIIC